MIFLICLVIGIFLGRLGLFEVALDNFSRWYRNKYGKFTPGDGKNYLQIFKKAIIV